MKAFHLTTVVLTTILLGAAVPRATADDAQVSLQIADEAETLATVAEFVEEPEDAELADTFDNLAEDNGYLTFEPPPYQPPFVARFGWWGVDVNGSKSGVGEWMGLQGSSAFFDVQGIRSNGLQTLDFNLTGPAGETNDAGVYFYGGPGFSMDVDYNRFIHRLVHDPLGGLPDANGFPPPGGFFDPVLSDGGIAPEQPGYPMFGEDFNPGEDYALRVQQLKANFKGRLTENLSWGLNVWGMKKDGVRQGNSQAHCFVATYSDGAGGTDSVSTCHAVSKGQQVNWLTVEVEPVITARFGWLTLEYSRTMRSFQQDDQIVTNAFTRNSPYGWGADGENAAYGYVSENYTEIDRLKVGAELGPSTDLYVVGNVGNTHNSFRDSDRKFYGVDGRLTNTSFDGLSMTLYGKSFTQNNSPDTTSLNDRYPSQSLLWLEQNQSTGVPVSPQEFYSEPPIEEPWYLGLVDREWLAFGTKARWRPFYNSCGLQNRLAVTGGYEWRQLSRTNVTYDLVNLPPAGVGVLFTQPTTVTNTFFAGLQQDWSYSLSSFIRYRMIETSWPLVGVTHREQLSLDAAVNSNLPEHEDRIEIGGTWNPTSNFMLNAQFWIQNTYNHSDTVNFDEDSYPIILSGWYTPSQQWSFTAGYATFSNWIQQDVTLGREDGSSATELTAFTAPWDYTGRADVINLGGAYVVNCDLTLTGGIEYTSNRNVVTNTPAPAGAVLPYDLGQYGAVRVDTLRLTLGADYRLTQNINCYGRYNYYDFDNQGWGYQGGTANMFLAGLSGVY